MTEWFVVNVRDAKWITHETFGSGKAFESPDAWFPELGFNIRVLQPGQPNALYHREDAQEDFLVLAGECTLLVEERERPLQAWDFVHLPPNTAHVIVGAGSGPSVVLMVGVRKEDKAITYPVSELARRFGASVEKETSSPQEAYAPYGELQVANPGISDPLPWDQ